MRHDTHALRMIRGLVAASGCLLAMTLAAQADGSKFKPHPDGFWKIHPPNDFKSEFGGEDVIGLANHQHITTDCSIVWKNKDKYYCFSSQMSSQFVQENPGAYLPSAAAFWAEEHRKKQSSKAKPGSNMPGSNMPDPNAVASGSQPPR